MFVSDSDGGNRRHRYRIRRIFQLLLPLALFIARSLSTAIAHHALAFRANKITEVTAILLLGLINYVNARLSNRLNAVLTVLKIMGIASLPLLAIFFGRAHTHWTPIVPPGASRVGASFGVATIGVLWAYDGWQYVPFASGEIRNPQKNIPKALILGVTACAAILCHGQHCLLARIADGGNERGGSSRREGRYRHGRSQRRTVLGADRPHVCIRMLRCLDARVCPFIFCHGM
jgi:hypothetical protein